MKPGICIVNTARGGVLDEAALVQAIDSGRVWSAGLDVYESEPKIHPGLISNTRVCLLPHMGTSTVEVRQKIIRLFLRIKCHSANIKIDKDKDGGMEHKKLSRCSGGWQVDQCGDRTNASRVIFKTLKIT